MMPDVNVFGSRTVGCIICQIYSCLVVNICSCFIVICISRIRLLNQSHSWQAVVKAIDSASAVESATVGCCLEFQGIGVH